MHDLLEFTLAIGLAIMIGVVYQFQPHSGIVFGFAIAIRLAIGAYDT